MVVSSLLKELEEVQNRFQAKYFVDFLNRVNEANNKALASAKISKDERKNRESLKVTVEQLLPGASKQSDEQFVAEQRRMHKGGSGVGILLVLIVIVCILLFYVSLQFNLKSFEDFQKFFVQQWKGLSKMMTPINGKK